MPCPLTVVTTATLVCSSMLSNESFIFINVCFC
jgi:hypothetical protein